MAKDRERGTNSLPFPPQLVLALYLIASTTISSIFLYHSSSHSSDDDELNIHELSRIIAMSTLGSFVTIYGGIVRGIPTFIQWMGMLLVGIWSWTLQQQQQQQQQGQVVDWKDVSTTMGYLMAMTSIFPQKLIPSTICHWIGTLATLPRLMGAMFLAIVLVSFNTSISSDNVLWFLPKWIITPLWIPMCLAIAYYRNWAHAAHGSLYNSHDAKNGGNQASTKTYGHHVMCMYFFVSTIIWTTTAETNGIHMDANLLDMALKAACVTVTLAQFFASVADVWYAVGTGQFQMISIDTAGIIFYFFCPLYILARRWLAALATAAVTNSAISNDSIVPAVVCLYAAMVVMSLLQLYTSCPLAGYIHANVYLHGQPNRKRIALSVHYHSDHFELYYPSNDKKNKKEKKNEKKTLKLNILVSLQDLIDLSHDEAKKQTIILHSSSGDNVMPTEQSQSSSNQQPKHEFVLSPCHSKEELQKALDLYSVIFGKMPSWYHASCCTDDVAILEEVTMTFNMRVAYWSVQLNKNTVVDTLQIDDGDFVYLNNTAMDKESMTMEQIQSVVQDIATIASNYEMETLSKVAVPLIPMRLS